MKLKQICLALLFFAVSTISAAAQSPVPAKNQPQPAISAEIKDKAVAFLRQTAKETRTLSLPENRVALTLAVGEMLWQHDEREARAAYDGSIADMRLMLEQLRQLATTPDDESDNWQQRGGYELFSGARQLRASLILGLAEHDADAAENFFRETHAFITAPSATGEDRMKTIFGETEETQLETRLATVISKNDPIRALKFAQEKLAKGITSEIIELAVRLHSKDAEKGAKLAGDILGKLKTAKINTDYQARTAALELFKKAAAGFDEAKKVGGKTPLLSEAELRELAEMIIKGGLSEDFQMYGGYEYRQNLELLTKFAPASAAQLQRKLDAPAVQTKSVQVASAPDEDAPTAAQAREQAETQRKYEQRTKDAETRRQELQSFQQRVASPGEKVTLEEARSQIAKIKKPEERMMATVAISIALAARGDKKTAKDLLAETRSRLVAQPKFAADMLAHLLVAHAYVTVDPPVAFEMLEGLVFQSNELIAAMIKLGEFALGSSAIENNEIRLGGIGQIFLVMVIGANSERGALGSQFGEFQSDFAKLAVTDFDRLQALTNKFDRTELRLIARIMVVQSLLNDDAPKESAPTTTN